MALAHRRGRLVASAAAALVVLGSLGPYCSASVVEATGPDPSPTPTATGVPGPGDAQRGGARAEALYCGVCHGPGGRSETPEWPSLAGQGGGYLAKQLTLFRSGERPNLEMGPIAATLTDDDIADLSAYYAAQSRPSPPPSPSPDGGAVVALYQDGDAARSIPACAECHGVTGSGDANTLAPALRAQQSTYVRTQLEAYARRSRYQSTVPPGLDQVGLQAMYDASTRLTADEMQQIALYLQSLN